MRSISRISHLCYISLSLMYFGCTQHDGGTVSANTDGEMSCTAIASALNLEIDQFITSLDASCTADSECVSAQIRVARAAALCVAGCGIAIAKSNAEKLSRFLEPDDELTLLCEDFAEKNCLTDVPSCVGGEPRCVGGRCLLADRDSN
jgi:hypothetical protein